MSWPRAILTDSGGFQVFSLRERRTVDDDGVTFRSHLDGSEQRLTPERAMAIQAALASDIAMAFDECPPSDAPRPVIEAAMARTTRWARAVPRRAGRAGPAPLRHRAGRRPPRSAARAPRRDRRAAVRRPRAGRPRRRRGARGHVRRDRRASRAEMPADRPRYLMGVGTPEDIWTAIGAGVDMFDCVMPTRNARNGQLFVRGGRLNIANAQYRDDPSPVEEGCPCECCASYSRGYLSHLFRAEELLYHRLASIHNLRALPRPGAAGARRDRAPGLFRRRRGSPTRMAKRVGVLLSGCGRLDGSDVAEAMLTLLVIERAGAQAICAAPDADQAGVVDHLTGERSATACAQRARRGGAHRPGRSVRCPGLNANDDRRADRAGRGGADRDAVRLPRQARALSDPSRPRAVCCARCCSRTGRWASLACRRCSRRACWGRRPACA